MAVCCNVVEAEKEDAIVLDVKGRLVDDAKVETVPIVPDDEITSVV